MRGRDRLGSVSRELWQKGSCLWRVSPALHCGRITDGLSSAEGKIPFVFANVLHRRQANSRALQAALLLPKASSVVRHQIFSGRIKIAFSQLSARESHQAQRGLRPGLESGSCHVWVLTQCRRHFLCETVRNSQLPPTPHHADLIPCLQAHALRGDPRL